MAKQNEFERQKNSEVLKDNALLKYQLELIKSKRESFEFADKSQQLLYEKNNEDLLLLSDQLTNWLSKVKKEDSRYNDMEQLLFSVWRISNYIQTLETISKSAVSELVIEKKRADFLASENHLMKLKSMNDNQNHEALVKSLRAEIQFLNDGKDG